MAKKYKFKTIFFGHAALPIWLALITFGLTELFSCFPLIPEIAYSQTLYPAIVCAGGGETAKEETGGDQ